MNEENGSLRTAQRLRLAVERLRRLVRQAGVMEGLSRPEEAALSRLERGGPLTTAQLAQREGLRPQSMGTVVKALEEGGYVTKSPDPRDGRQMLVEITEAGRAAVRAINEVRDRDLAALLERNLTPEQRAQLTTVLAFLEDLEDR